MKKNLYIVMLEPLQKRYTSQWHQQFKQKFSKYFNVIYIDAKYEGDVITTGRFLDVYKTNRYKAEQVIEFSKLFENEVIKDGDIFLFADGWHPGIINLKYMAQLSNIKIKIFTFLHAGSWDDFDFITQAGFRDWCKGFEESIIECCDGHFVATKFHKNIIENYFEKNINKIHVVGFPMDWRQCIKGVKQYKKEDIVVFPHRLDKEKQPEIFDKMAKEFPNYKFIKTMPVTKTKQEYYEILSKSKVCFSASLQETYGIGSVEALLFNCAPLVPDRLSYSEMYYDLFKYNNISQLYNKLQLLMKPNNDVKMLIQKNKKKIIKDSLDAFKKMSMVMNK